MHCLIPFGLVAGLNVLVAIATVPDLKSVHVVFRHGDRTPDGNGHEMFPNDPHQGNSFYPTGYGQLTIGGKRRAYQLGTILRHRYKEFLSNVYTPKLVEARSSEYDRTKMTLQLVLAALFPPGNVQKWHKELNWQPIPASYTPRVDDNVILSDECPRYLDEYNRVLNLTETKNTMQQFQDLKRNLTKLTGKSMEQPLDLYYLYHTFMAESSLGLILPEWAYDYFPYGQLFDAIVAAYNIANFNTLLKRLFAGPLIRITIDNMIAAQNVSGAPLTKIYLYSGHETNIAALLHAFNVYEPHVPEYSSAIILELQMVNDDYYVKLLYYHGIPPNIQTLKMPSCDELCPFDIFLDLISNLIPSDEELVCDKRQTPDYANTEYPAGLQSAEYNLIKSSKRKGKRL